MWDESTVLDAGSMGQSVPHSMDSLFPGLAPQMPVITENSVRASTRVFVGR